MPWSLNSKRIDVNLCVYPSLSPTKACFHSRGNTALDMLSRELDGILADITRDVRNGPDESKALLLIAV